MRRSAAASTAWSAPPVTLERHQHDRLVAGGLGARPRPAGARPRSSMPLTACAALSIAAAQRGRVLACGCRRRGSAARSGRRGSRLSASETAWEPEPGTSKPPPVRCLVCCAANGTASDEEHDPDAQNETPAARDEALEPVHGCLHGASDIARRRGIFSCPLGGLLVHSALQFWARPRIESTVPNACARQGGSEWSKRPPTGARGAARAAEVHSVPTSDGTEIRLTRYQMGTKGPIVLAPGYGNAARAFAIDTVPKNCVQYLGEHGYDVWLLDYRASPDLPSSCTQFTVDDIAMRDWPAAIDAVRARDRRGLGAGDGPLRRRPVAVHGHRRRPARACARRPSPSLAGHPIATPGNQRARRRPPGDDVQEARDQGPEHRLRPRLPARPRGRARDARAALPPRLRQPGRPPHLLHLRRRLRLLEHQRADDGRRPCRASSASATSRSSSTSR